MSRKGADGLLLELGQRIGMPGLCLDDAGCCQLAFDQRWLVTVTHAAARGSLLLHCPLSAAGSADDLGAGLLLALLQANFMGRSTLAVSPDRRVAVLIELGLAQANASLLYHALEQLLNAAEAWSERLLQPVALPLRAGERGMSGWFAQRV